MPDPRATAFERVFRADHAALVAYCYRRVGDYELARDITADTFRVAWSRWDEPRRSDRAWLFGVARNLIGNEYRRRSTRPPVPWHLDSGSDPADQRSDAGFDAVDVRSVLCSLAAGHQEVLRLTYWDGLSAAEVADSLGTTTAAVWVRLSRARRAFTRAWQARPSQDVDVSTRTTS